MATNQELRHWQAVVAVTFRVELKFDAHAEKQAKTIARRLALEQVGDGWDADVEVRYVYEVAP